MATDKETPSEVKVGSSEPEKNASKFFKPKVSRKGLIYLILLVVGVGVVILASWTIIKKELHIGEKVYAQAAGHKVYKPEIINLLKGVSGISYHQAATVLANKYLTEAMGKQSQVSVTDNDIEAAYGKNALTQNKTQPYYYQQKVNQLYMQKLNAYNTGIYKGQYIIANYSRNIPYPSPLLAEQKAADPNLGNPKSIAKDKKYASDFITGLYTKITDKQISFNQAMQTERQNPVVGEKAYPTQPHSGSFDTSSGYGSFITIPSTYAKVKTIKAGTTSKPFIGGDTNGNGTGLYYLIVHMDESRGGSDVPFNQYVKQSKQKFGYKINV
jgi:hypothetical protein